MKGKRLSIGSAERAGTEQEPPLYNAIAALNEFTKSFSTIGIEELVDPSISAGQRVALLRRIADEASEILTEDPANLFEQQCKKEKSRDPQFKREVFARMEKMRAMAAVSKFEKISELHELYSENPAYKLVLSYLNFLDHLPEEKASTSQLRTLKGKQTPQQRSLIREWLIKNKIISNINQEDFEYLFSEQLIIGMRPIKFLKPASWAKRLLFIMVEGFENKGSADYNIANQCIILKSGRKLDSNTKVTKDAAFKEILQMI